MDGPEIRFHAEDDINASVQDPSEAKNRPQAESKSNTNRFKDAENLPELINQLVAASSSCWVGDTGAAKFDTDQANQIADEAKERLAELGLANFG